MNWLSLTFVNLICFSPVCWCHIPSRFIRQESSQLFLFPDWDFTESFWTQGPWRDSWPTSQEFFVTSGQSNVHSKCKLQSRIIRDRLQKKKKKLTLRNCPCRWSNSVSWTDYSWVCRLFNIPDRSCSSQRHVQQKHPWQMTERHSAAIHSDVNAALFRKTRCMISNWSNKQTKAWNHETKDKQETASEIKTIIDPSHHSKHLGFLSPEHKRR